MALKDVVVDPAENSFHLIFEHAEFDLIVIIRVIASHAVANLEKTSDLAYKTGSKVFSVATSEWYELLASELDTA